MRGVLLLVSGVCLLLACGPSQSHPPPPSTCPSGTSCPPPTAPPCTKDGDCPSANCNLSSGQCGPSRMGLSCSSSADCGQAPAFCELSSLGAGLCSATCTSGSGAAACPTGSDCFAARSSGALCLKLCPLKNECAPGELCEPMADGRLACQLPCGLNSDCGAGQQCNVATGACAPPGPAPGALGAACASAGDCKLGAGAFCGTYPGGYCSISCVSAACPAGGACADFGGGDKDCLEECLSRDDCRVGYACAVQSNGDALCLPGCSSNGDCTSPKTCDLPSAQCMPPLTDAATLDTVDLTPGGAIPVGSSTLSATLSVTVPSDAVSLTFVGIGTDPSIRLVAYRIISPGGTVYDYGSASTSPMKVNAPAVPGGFAVLIPNSPNVPLTSGTWSVNLLAAQNTTATVSALIKRAAVSRLTAGTVDMNLFFVGAPGVSAATAPSHPDFQRMLDHVRAAWGQGGLRIGQVKYFDLSSADVAQFQDVNEADLGKLMPRSAMPGAIPTAMNVFFVRTIVSSGTLSGYIVLGETAGLPGMPILGTTGSGVAVTMADFPQGASDAARTWAHEGGHWLGLFHPTESAGTAFDPLPDTPQCPSSMDANADHIMEPSECVGAGAEEEMFWTSVTAIPNSVFTPQQGGVMLGNAVVH